MLLWCLTLSVFHNYKDKLSKDFKKLILILFGVLHSHDTVMMINDRQPVIYVKINFLHDDLKLNEDNYG